MPFHSNVKNLVFDVLSPFYNVLNLKNTYNRFNTYFRQNPEDSTIYEFAVQNNWSLLSKMIDSNDRDYEVNLHGFLSDGVLRNAEVLNALSERIRASRFGSYSSKNSVCIKEFYSKIRQSGMRTYPRTKKDIPYQIQFMFLDAICNFLETCDQDAFETIYSRQEEAENAIAALFTAKTYAPVSYTHLDVYKRQALPRAESRKEHGCTCQAGDASGGILALTADEQRRVCRLLLAGA